MPRLGAQIDAELVSQVDDLVAAGVVKSRSDAVRRGLREMIQQRRMVDEEIVQGYLKHPQTEDEMALAHASAMSLLREFDEEDPW